MTVPTLLLNILGYAALAIGFIAVLIVIDDLTLRNIIYQVYGEWNSLYTREDLESIGQDALGEASYHEGQAEADKWADRH